MLVVFEKGFEVFFRFWFSENGPFRRGESCRRNFGSEFFAKIHRLSIADEIGPGHVTVVGLARGVIAASCTGMQIDAAMLALRTKPHFYGRFANQFMTFPAIQH